MKRLKLFTMLSLALSFSALTAQENTEVVVVNSEPISLEQQEWENNYYGMNQNYVNFTSDQKKFKDWTLAIYAGVPMVQGSDLNSSVSGEGMKWGYDLQAVLTKQITHAFGLGLQFNYGKAGLQTPALGGYEGDVQYRVLSLIGDINFSNLLRRVDNKSRYAWALHGYGGLATFGYDTNISPKNNQRINKKTGTNMGSGSLGIVGGGGLRYKINQSIDAELKAMYYYTGDEEFDGSTSVPGLSEVNERKEDGMFVFNLGLIWKIGKHYEHLAWADPLADIYPGHSPQDLQDMLVVCAQGDKDDDGVCDDWDRELDTPAGARVDGAGRALDTDLDGIIDLYDKCVTLAGPAENDGCPTNADSESLLNFAIANLEFTLDSDVISPSYYPLLDRAAEYLKYYKDNTYDVIGHTDARASKAYNMNLSQRRAEAVKSYLVEKGGVNVNQLNVVAMGEEDLRFPECKPASKCPEWKNHANRRVVFVLK